MDFGKDNSCSQDMRSLPSNINPTPYEAQFNYNFSQSAPKTKIGTDHM